MTADWKIAIDGPAASGKTTVGRRLAGELGFALVDTGAMYRAVALEALKRDLDRENAAALGALAEEMAPLFRFQPDAGGREGFRLLVGERDVTDRLHDEIVSAVVPMVAALSAVRRTLVAVQRRIGLGGGVVMTGRDIGTVVLPEAEVKIFLTASAEERARRRCLDLKARGEPFEPQEVLASIRERDQVDSSRADSPLRQAEGAHAVDTTRMSMEEVVRRILDLIAAARVR